MIEVGKIVRPHGVRGEIKVRIPDELIEMAPGMTEVLLAGESSARKVMACRVHQGAWLLKLEGVETRNLSESLRGKSVSVLESELPRSSAESILPTELLGMQVQDNDGNLLGYLTEVLATGSNDVYVVTRPNGRELLLPALQSVVHDINGDSRIIKVTIPDGL